MDVYIFDQQSVLPISHHGVQEIAIQVVKLEKHRYDEVAINFVEQQEISQIHLKYFNDPSPTDCISFPIDDIDETGYRVMGDIFVCPEVACEYAIKHKSDPYYETTLYIVHGLLHLMGYDDINEVDRQEMRKAEERHMKNLQARDLILHK